MKITIQLENHEYNIDLNNPIDIAIPVRRAANVNAYDLPDPSFETVKAGDFIGDVNKGGSCNVENITLSPHGNGTHTECLGHISKAHEKINACLNDFMMPAALITANIVEKENVVNKKPILQALESYSSVKSLVIRTLPNADQKRHQRYANTNPPYIEPSLMESIVNAGIEHLLIDLPSVDQEDDPKLSSHHLFFAYPSRPRKNATITELIYVPNDITDGLYLLNLQVPAIASDASPSRPCLYELE